MPTRIRIPAHQGSDMLLEALFLFMSSVRGLVGSPGGGTFEFPKELLSFCTRHNAGVSDQVANGIGFDGGGKGITYHVQELDPVTGKWEKTPFCYPVPHRITSVSSRKGGKVVYRGSEHGLFDDLAVDPEGRFLLLHSYGTGDLFSMDVDGPSFELRLLFSSADVPHLARATNLRILDHETLGHRFVLFSEGRGGLIPLDARRTVLHDYENDGLFDAVETFDTARWASSPFADSSKWRSPTRLD